MEAERIPSANTTVSHRGSASTEWQRSEESYTAICRWRASYFSETVTTSEVHGNSFSTLTSVQQQQLTGVIGKHNIRHCFFFQEFIGWNSCNIHIRLQTLLKNDTFFRISNAYDIFDTFYLKLLKWNRRWGFFCFLKLIIN